MKISDTPFTVGHLFNHLPAEPGVHDVGWITRIPGCGVMPDSRVSVGMFRFLYGVGQMIDRVDQSGRYEYGTAYCRIMRADTVRAGRFHYDTRTGCREIDHNAGLPVWRFTAISTTDGHPASNLFTEDGTLHGQHPRVPLIRLPDNDRVVMFSEGEDLHARVATAAAPGQLRAFFSATLYAAEQTPDLSCPALAPLRKSTAAPRWVDADGTGVGRS